MKKTVSKLAKKNSQNKVQNKKTTKATVLANILEEATKSKDFKNIKSLINDINSSEIQTNENRRECIARIYIHCKKLFKKSNPDQGRKAYLLSLFPQTDNEKKKTNQYYRNKYGRALRLLEEQKAPTRFSDLTSLIKEIGLQNLFNGKINNDSKKGSKSNLNTSIRGLLKKHSPNKIIRALVKTGTAEKIKGDFIVCCIDGNLFYTSKDKLVKQLKKEGSLSEIKAINQQD